MQGLGLKAINEIKSELNKLNKEQNLNLNFDYSSNLSLKKETYKFSDLIEKDQINFFILLESIFDDTRTLNVFNNLKLNYVGDLHQNMHSFPLKIVFYVQLPH